MPVNLTGAPSQIWLSLSARNYSHSIDEVSYSKLVTGGADICLKALDLSHATPPPPPPPPPTPHVGDRLMSYLLMLLVFSSRTGNSDHLQHCLGLRMVEEDARSPFRLLLTPLATTKWNVVVTGIVFTGTTSPKTHFFSCYSICGSRAQEEVTFTHLQNQHSSCLYLLPQLEEDETSSLECPCYFNSTSPDSEGGRCHSRPCSLHGIERKWLPTLKHVGIWLFIPW